MNRKGKKLLHDLQTVATHFKLKLSNIEILRDAAIALDPSKKKMLVMKESDYPYFKTIDLEKVETCAIKVEYRNIDAGDLQERDMDDFVEGVELHIAHYDPLQSVKINFYNARQHTKDNLKGLIEKATTWRDLISKMLPRRVSVTHLFNPA